VGIGQIELTRPGDKSFDTTANLINSTIDPAGVFYTSVNLLGTPSFSATANVASEIYVDATDLANGGHSTRVAGVMISTGAATAGVAPQAKLFASGNVVGMFQDSLDIDSVTGQYIATRNNGNISAINMSFGYNALPGELGDGTSKISSFVDWSARVHDVLYVIAGSETSVPGRRLSDNFNGITVAMSKRDTNNIYSIVDGGNIFHSNPLSPRSQRTYTDLLAPGAGVTVAGQGNSSRTVSGTSFAAPHVTGTVALLQEHAITQINNGITGWNPNENARRHEVMKAVLMNSADKVAGRLGSTRTVFKQDGVSTWDDSFAAFDDLLPLDEEMGAGHLNAARAVQQFAPGEFEPNGAPVPVIGWDYSDAGGLNSIKKYAFNQELLQNSYISITLAWDREVTFSSDGGVTGVFDSGDEFNGYSEIDADDVINDLDLFLMPRGSTSTDPVSDAIWSSLQDYMPLEHLFVPIDVQGEYEIWVQQTDADLGGGQDYGIAWWAVGIGPLLSGDFDNDNDVDGADFLTWQRNHR